MTLNALEYDACFVTGFQAQTKMAQQLLELIKGVIQASDRELDSSIFKGFFNPETPGIRDSACGAGQHLTPTSMSELFGAREFPKQSPKS